MVAAGTVQLIMHNKSALGLSPFKQPSHIVDQSEALLANPRFVASGNATGKAGAFATQPNGPALNVVSIYEIPDSKKVLILLVTYAPQGSNNVAKAAIYDAVNTKIEPGTLRECLGNKNFSANYEERYVNESGEQKITVVAKIGNELFATAKYVVTIEATS